MVIKTASPGVIVNEIDLTRGTSDGITTNVGGMVGPFARGPVDEMVLIETEAEFQKTFGNPTTENAEYWWTVSNFLEYGGVIYVIRCDDASGGTQLMKNSVTNGDPVYIKNRTDFEENFDDGISLPAYFAARTPGKYGDSFGVAVIDHGADQQLTLGTTTIKDNNGAVTSSATRPDTTIEPGTGLDSYEAVRAPGFSAPTGWATPAATNSTSDITLNGEQDVNGVTTSSSRVLVMGQTEASENGIYVSAAGAWTRAVDAANASDFEFDKSVEVSGGAGAGTYYYDGSDDPVVGTDDIAFTNVDPAPPAPAVFDYVILDGGTGAATGYISRIDSTTNPGELTLYLAVASGSFVSSYQAGAKPVSYTHLTLPTILLV